MNLRLRQMVRRLLRLRVAVVAPLVVGRVGKKISMSNI
jgi:hypothetical protein